MLTAISLHNNLNEFVFNKQPNIEYVYERIYKLCHRKVTKTEI